MNLVDAIKHRHLVHWHDAGHVRTVEPHLLAQYPGARLVLIAYQVAGGADGTAGWRVIDVHDGLNVHQHATFRHARPIPRHLLDSVQLAYATGAQRNQRPLKK